LSDDSLHYGQVIPVTCFHADETLVEHGGVSAAENEASRANIQSRMSLNNGVEIIREGSREGREKGWSFVSKCKGGLPDGQILDGNSARHRR